MASGEREKGAGENTGGSGKENGDVVGADTVAPFPGASVSLWS